jgi:hypothetical protein
MNRSKWDYDGVEPTLGQPGRQDHNVDGTPVYLPSPRDIADATAAFRCAHRRFMAGRPLESDAGLPRACGPREDRRRAGRIPRIHRLVVGGRSGRGVAGCGDG